MLVQIKKIKIVIKISEVITEREKINVIRNNFEAKYKVSNLFDIIIKQINKQWLRNVILQIPKEITLKISK